MKDIAYSEHAERLAELLREAMHHIDNTSMITGGQSIADEARIALESFDAATRED